MIEKNSPEVWDNVWRDLSLKNKEKILFEREIRSLYWKRMKKILLKNFGTLKGLKTIEIGAGSAVYSLILASEGANVTVLDYSKNAIKLSKSLFKKRNLTAKFLKRDAFKLSKEYLSQFDVSISFGTAEHFSGEKRLDFIKTHFSVLKKGGLAFISVPNRWNAPYRLHKFLSQFFGRWKFGEEYPFSPCEFKKIGKEINQKFNFIGESIFSDPFNILARFKKLLKISDTNSNKTITIGTPLDKYFARFFTAYSQK